MAGFFGADQAAFIGGLYSLFQDTAGCRAYLNSGIVRNKRIDALGLGHTCTVARMGGSRKRIIEESVHWSSGINRALRREPGQPVTVYAASFSSFAGFQDGSRLHSLWRFLT